MASAKRPRIKSISRMPQCQDRTELPRRTSVLRSNVSSRSSVPHHLPARGEVGAEFAIPVTPVIRAVSATRATSLDTDCPKASRPPGDADIARRKPNVAGAEIWFRLAWFCRLGRHDRGEMIDVRVAPAGTNPILSGSAAPLRSTALPIRCCRASIGARKSECSCGRLCSIRCLPR